MSKPKGGTIRERLATLEVLLCNHIKHHEKIEKWMLAIIAIVVGRIVLQVLPGAVKWLATVL